MTMGEIIMCVVVIIVGALLFESVWFNKESVWNATALVYEAARGVLVHKLLPYMRSWRGFSNE